MDTMPKTMVQGSKAVGREVPVARDMAEMPVNKIENYYEFPTSNNQSFTTYENRAAALVEALGNKDSVKG